MISPVPTQSDVPLLPRCFRLHDYSMDTYFQIEGDYLTLGALSSDFKESNMALAQNRAPEYKGY